MRHAFDALRILLGSILIVTAMGYFIPMLVPALPDFGWSNPQAARLMEAFEASGLLACGKCIQLLAGALLLLNRAVPFALAALLPVNVCAAYIALVTEGDLVRGVLATMVLALNGVLMLAHISAYKSALAQGQLSDGESEEAGENYNSLFVNPLTNPAPLQLGAALVVLLAAGAFYYKVVPFTNGDTGLVVLAFPSVILLIHCLRFVRRRKASDAGR